MEIERLVEKCLAGDRGAQKMLYEKYAGEFYATSLRYARHELEAQDILQDAFILIFEKLDTLKNAKAFRAWGKRIVIHEAIRNYKKASFQREKMGLEEYEQETIESNAVEAMTADEIMNVISKLPDGYRTVFNLYAIEGYKHKEIAKILGIGVSTSRSQLAKARKILRTFLENLNKHVS